MAMRKLISFWEVVFWCCHPIISTFQLLVWMTDGLNRFLCLIGKYSTALCSVCVYVCAYDKHSFLIYSVYLEGLPRSDSDIPVQRVFLLWYRTKECWAYALSSKKKEYYLFVQLQEGWFSYVNSRLILFVTQSTKSFIPVFKRKSLPCGDKEFQRTVATLLPSTRCCMVNITGFIHLMLPAVCFGVNTFQRD